MMLRCSATTICKFCSTRKPMNLLSTNLVLTSINEFLAAAKVSNIGSERFSFNFFLCNSDYSQCLTMSPKRSCLHETSLLQIYE